MRSIASLVSRGEVVKPPLLNMGDGRMSIVARWKSVGSHVEHVLLISMDYNSM